MIMSKDRGFLKVLKWVFSELQKEDHSFIILKEVYKIIPCAAFL